MLIPIIGIAAKNIIIEYNTITITSSNSSLSIRYLTNYILLASFTSFEVVLRTLFCLFAKRSRSNLHSLADKQACRLASF